MTHGLKHVAFLYKTHIVFINKIAE